jgi:hypothetical protein
MMKAVSFSHVGQYVPDYMMHAPENMLILVSLRTSNLTAFSFHLFIVSFCCYVASPYIKEVKSGSATRLGGIWGRGGIAPNLS